MARRACGYVCERVWRAWVRVWVRVWVWVRVRVRACVREAPLRTRASPEPWSGRVTMRLSERWVIASELLEAL